MPKGVGETDYVYYEALIPSSVGVGWKELVDPLVSICESAGGRVEQVKEKFGTLRFYYSAGEGNEWFWGGFGQLVNAAENMSRYVCEFTGKPGRLRTIGSDGKGRWTKTLSPEEAVRQGYALDRDEQVSNNSNEE